MPDAATLLEVEDVSKQYESADGAEPIRVLAGASLIVRQGESVAVRGPSGSGKSTLLNIIGTLDRPTSGRVLLEGRDLTGLGDRDLAAIRARRIGFVFQLHHLLPQCTVLENVLIPAMADKSRPSWPELHEHAERLLRRVGLGERMSHRPGELSGGERQRAAVVRALINRPSLLLADEPTGSLDRSASQELSQLLVELNFRDGVTLIVVTHSDALARRMGRVLELRDGKLLPAGEGT